MDNKRKSTGSSTRGGGGDGDDPAAKRRKAEPAKDDLSNGETHGSTTVYGLKLLDAIRKVADKNGRKIAGRFEYLPPRDENKEYYEQTRMPISLKTIERKLNNGDFATLSDLESFFKRMIANNKEFYSKNSGLYEDTERIRKALSNYMRATNPAHSKPGSTFTCQAAPIPDDYEPSPYDFGDGDDGDAAEKDAEGDRGKHENVDADAELDADGDTKMEPEKDAGDGNADGDDDAEGDDADEDEDEEEEDEEEEEDDDDDEEEVKSRKRIILKRRSVGRTSRHSTAQSTPARSIKPSRGKPDHDYVGVPYKGLTFQQAQEKIVEEMLREHDENGDPYFLDFINLPPRSMKDYFSVIVEPLSLKGLQKLVKGIHGRQQATGVSDFKSWASFEERASLLWTNAHYYNEEGSDVYETATELKDYFEDELHKAKAEVQEPPQPAQSKIKLKVPPAPETSSVSGKKITIHVGGSRGSAAASPALAPSQSDGMSVGVMGTTSSANGAPASRDGTVVPVVPRPGLSVGQLAVGPPSPSVMGLKQEPVVPQRVSIQQASVQQASFQQAPFQPASLVAHPRANGVAETSVRTANGMPMPNQVPSQSPAGIPMQNGYPPVMVRPPPPPLLHPAKFRAPDRGANDALLSRVTVRAHPSIRVEKRFKCEVVAHHKLSEQTITVHVPASQKTVQIIPTIPPLEQQLRQYRLFVQVNGVTMSRAPPLPIADDPLPLNAVVFEGSLIPGSNIIQVTIAGALPKGQKLPNGADYERERITILANLLRH